MVRRGRKNPPPNLDEKLHLRPSPLAFPGFYPTPGFQKAPDLENDLPALAALVADSCTFAADDSAADDAGLVGRRHECGQLTCGQGGRQLWRHEGGQLGGQPRGAGFGVGSGSVWSGWFGGHCVERSSEHLTEIYSCLEYPCCTSLGMDLRPGGLPRMPWDTRRNAGQNGET